jgi:hypothetical protein
VPGRWDGSRKSKGVPNYSSTLHFYLCIKGKIDKPFSIDVGDSSNFPPKDNFGYPPFHISISIGSIDGERGKKLEKRGFGNLLLFRLQHPERE